MEELKVTLPDALHTEVSNRIRNEQLVQEGKALEAREKKLGVWQIVKQHKIALVYSTFSIGF
jgi:hypothetical protein